MAVNRLINIIYATMEILIFNLFIFDLFLEPQNYFYFNYINFIKAND